MNFLLSDDLVQFRDVLRALLAKECSGAALRRFLLDPYTGAPVTQEPFAATLWQKLVEAGVLAAALPERGEGLGLGTIALQVMLEESGRSLVPLPIFETLVFGFLPLQAIDIDPSLEEEMLVALANGAKRFTGPFFSELSLPRASSSGSGEVLEGEISFISSAAAATDLLLFATSDSGVALYLVDPTKVALETVPTLDLLRGFSSVQLAATPARRLGTLRDAARLTQLQQLACVAELAGVGSRTLEMTVEYVKTRQQFGRPIGSFQAVQHKLADMLLRVEQAMSLGRFSAWAADADPAQLAQTAVGAKGFASEVIPLVVEQAIQAHGGIGFTYEYDLHLFLRRARTLAALCGSSESSYFQLGNQLLA